MDRLGPPWQYIEPRVFYTFAAIMGFIAAILIILIIAFFVNKFFKYRHETKIACIQSGNLDPMQTQTGAFLVFRRGIVLVCLGLNVGAVAIVNHPFPLAFLPFTLGMAYLLIYFIHVKGVLRLFPENGKSKPSSKQNNGEVELAHETSSCLAKPATQVRLHPVLLQHDAHRTMI